MSSADCRIAPAKRSKKWRVDPGADAAAAERVAGRRADRDGDPVGPDQPGPVDQRALLARARLRSDIRRSAGCRAGSAPGCRRSRARRARRSRGRSRAGSNSSAVSSTAGIKVPCAHRGRAVGEHAGAGAAAGDRTVPRRRPRAAASAAAAAPAARRRGARRAGIEDQGRRVGDARRRRRRLGRGAGAGAGCGT